MRIIHTSDWHLGQHFYGKTRLNEHQQFLTWLVDLVQQEQVDAVIVAGDIFDTGAPPSYARELFNRCVIALKQVGCQLVLLGGNHDSVAMLTESRQILTFIDTALIPAATHDYQSHIIELTDKNDAVSAIVGAIPFIRARDVVTSSAGQTGDQKKQQLQQAISDYYANIYQCAQQRQQALREQGTEVPIILTGHLTTVNSQTSESVRDLYIGTLDAFPADGFPPADYIALGHIHRAQKVGGTEHIRYSGSPIPLSFDELNKAKTVNLVEFDMGQLHQVTPIEVPLFQPMKVIKGEMAHIKEQLEVLARNAQADACSTQDSDQPTWLDIEVVASDFISDIQTQLQQLTRELHVEVLLSRRAKVNREHGLNENNKESLHELSVQEVFARRLQLESDYLSEKEQDPDPQLDKYMRVKNMFTEITQSIELANKNSNDAS
ncbi:exonuclease subunit SbcD [Flocculibacter collagenilyticus]|uniref:exonuclease subunit SbcD n=1 Tax=Flocculibacter collagenilyticus TaxID=2744479 RepID=UPI0018F42F7B|nr:exonuclease subunit SbcD [Flocculibacter collagenilyticus]